jgi:hypothetical protein
MSMKSKLSFLIVTLTLSVFWAGSSTSNGAWAQAGTCVGDCNHDDRITVNEIITGVNVILGTLPLETCPALDRGADGTVTVGDLIVVVNNALAGCGSTGNHAPQASDVSFNADTSTPYIEKQLIGSDPDNDTITYELIADESGTGYSFAYVDPESGVLYLTLTPEFQGGIVLPYHVTDGKLFSNSANVTIEVEASIPSRNGGVEAIDPKEFASHPRGFFNGDVLGAPGAAPRLPTAVDLSKDYPLPGDQGQQGSCVGWALGYGIKSYQERVELGWSLEPAEHRFSPAYIYNQLNGGQDRGLKYSAALDFIVNQGVATLARMPYNEHDFLTQPSAAADQEAAQFKAKSWNTANGILEIKNALANHLGVLLVVQELEDMWYLKGPDSVYNTYQRPFSASHAVVAVGYDDNRYGGALRVLNSWGQNWGDGGFFWLPYAAANYTVDTPNGVHPVLTGAVVVEDLPDAFEPPPDPVDPPLPTQLPDLQVTDWKANFDGRPGGSGSLQYTVTNTGVATAPAGAYVAVVVSSDPTFKTGTSLVVYERIPFTMPPGTTAYRDQSHAIAFNFPHDLQPGRYYMAAWADIWNDVVESNEDNNISPAANLIEIANTLPDVEGLSWYAEWNGFGNGALTYDIINNGASTAPAGWLISLVLSPDDIIGNGNEIFLFAESAGFAIPPGGTLYRDDFAPGYFSLYYDTSGYRVADGVYYIAFWLDPNNGLAESNKGNNASLSWGTVRVHSGFGFSRDALQDGGAAAENETIVPSKVYNGKTLPARQASSRKVRISTTAQGNRQMQFLDDGTDTVSAPRLKAAESHPLSKLARARQQVIFPVSEMQLMPDGN